MAVVVAGVMADVEIAVRIVGVRFATSGVECYHIVAEMYVTDEISR